MTSGELDDFLNHRGVRFKVKQMQYGRLYRCDSGETFALYDSGKIVCGGKTTELSNDVKSWAKPDAESPVKTGEASVPARAGQADKSVFIVYGHDTTAREGLELILHKMGLKPIVLANLATSGDTIIEKLERYVGEHGNVGFAFVLLTPDDEGHIAGKAEQKKYRARQNVILELGMVLARLGRRRVLIVIKESVEQPSDIAGLIYRTFKERVDELRASIFKDLQEAGFKPDPAGL